MVGCLCEGCVRGTGGATAGHASASWSHVDVIEASGLQQLPRDWVRPLGDKLWELRLTGRDGIARAIYLTATGERVVIVRIFVKKTQKTPRRELELARERAKEVR